MGVQSGKPKLECPSLNLGGNSTPFDIKIGARWKIEISYRSTVAKSGGLLVGNMCSLALTVGRRIVWYAIVCKRGTHRLCGNREVNKKLSNSFTPQYPLALFFIGFCFSNPHGLCMYNPLPGQTLSWEVLRNASRIVDSNCRVK